MTTIPVSGSAVQLTQSLTQASTIQNAGSSNVYLDVSSAVTDMNYGIELKPQSAIQWPANSELWAVCKAGESSTLTVLYNAENVTLGSVDTVITGPVTATIDGTVDANITNASIAVTGDVNANISNAVVPIQGDVGITSGTVNATIDGDVSVNGSTVNIGGVLTPVHILGTGRLVPGYSGAISSSISFDVNVNPDGDQIGSSLLVRFSLTGTQTSPGEYIDLAFTFDNTSAGEPDYTVRIPLACVAAFNTPLEILLPFYGTYPVRVQGSASANVSQTTYNMEILEAPGYPNQPLILTAPSESFPQVSINGGTANAFVRLPPSSNDVNFYIQLINATCTRADLMRSVLGSGSDITVSTRIIGFDTVDSNYRYEFSLPANPHGLLYLLLSFSGGGNAYISTY